MSAAEKSIKQLIGDGTIEREFSLLDDNEIPPSVVLALLGPGQGLLDGPSVADFVMSGGSDILESRYIGKSDIPGAIWEIELTFAPLTYDDNETTKALLWLGEAARVRPGHVESAVERKEEEMAACDSEFLLGIAGMLGEHAIGGLCRHYEILSAVVPDAPAFYDVNACVLRGGSFVRRSVETEIPPHLGLLYSVHVVYGDENGGLWLHTHGLRRCRVLDIEMLDTPPDALSCCTALLHKSAELFIDTGIPEPNRNFRIGKGIELVWLPWEDAVGRVSKNCPGASRDGRDSFHSCPAATVFAPVGSLSWAKLVSPAAYRPQFEGGVTLFVSPYEQERNRHLAREGFETFTKLYEKFGNRKDWAFIIQLAFPKDDAAARVIYVKDSLSGAEEERIVTPGEDRTGREYLWFHVDSLDKNDFKGTLLNDPLDVRALRRGKSKRLSLEMLANWTIVGPHGRFGPDSVSILQEELAKSGDDDKEDAGSD